MLHPLFDARIGSVEFSYASSYGVIRSNWSTRGQAVDWNVTIPGNATGWLELSAIEAAHYKLEGVPLSESKLAKALNGGDVSLQYRLLM